MKPGAIRSDSRQLPVSSPATVRSDSSDHLFLPDLFTVLHRLDRSAATTHLTLMGSLSVVFVDPLVTLTFSTEMSDQIGTNTYKQRSTKVESLRTPPYQIKGQDYRCSLKQAPDRPAFLFLFAEARRICHREFGLSKAPIYVPLDH